MSATQAAPLRIVLYEGVGSRSLGPQRRLELLLSLLEGGYQVTCHGSGSEPGRSHRLAVADGSDVLVLAEKDAEGVPGEPDPFAAGGIAEGLHEGGSVRVHFRDITGVDPQAVLQRVTGVQEETRSHRCGEWKPWFPVIDYGRCTNCMQCLSFCLFDVYGVDAESNIEVRNPQKCKTNCPACSRVCPEVAILFPKYGSGPINGAEVNAQDVEREKMKVDISALLGGDIYSLLRERHERARSRFSKERDESKALKERLRCLKKLGADMDIPPEVVASLPSMDQIQSKAREAQEAARRALEERAARGNGDTGSTS